MPPRLTRFDRSTGITDIKLATKKAITMCQEEYKHRLSYDDRSKKISKARLIIKNIGRGKPQSLKNFAKSEWKKFGAKGEIKFGKIPYRKNEVMRYVPLVN